MRKCLICNWIQKDFIKWTDFWLNTTKKEYKIVKCSKCWLENIYPSLSDNEIKNLYKSDYYSYHDSNESITISSLRERIFNFIHIICWVNKKDFDIKSYSEWKWKNFLDIWCWNWTIIKLMSKYNYNSEGFEIWDTSKKWNIFYWNSIVDTDFWKKYDLIYISHVFEHINNPIEFLNKVKKLLNNEWKCIILIPNINCLSSKLFKQYAMERDIPRHLYNYNYSNLETFLINNWFSVIQKSKLKQYSLFDSFNLFIKTKYDINLSNKFYWIILRMFTTLFIENLLNMFKNTNQMGFIITKK